MYGVIITAAALIIILISICILVYLKDKNEKEEAERKRIEEQKAQIEKERRIKEKQRAEEEAKHKAEEERKLNTFCLICEKCSMGYLVCDDCYNRSKVLKKELPYKRISTYDNIHEYKNELMMKILNPETQFERETNCIKLLSVADILKNKYKESDAFDKTYNFFENINSDKTTEEIIAEYKLQEKTESESQEQNKFIDYRTIKPKPFRCKDGHYVRSKSEREIDDFFFDNRIFHIYEAEYKDSITGHDFLPDFYLPDFNLYLEYFGLNTKEYLDKAQSKINMYKSDDNINFEYLTYEDDNNIYTKLKDICFKYNIPTK